MAEKGEEEGEEEMNCHLLITSRRTDKGRDKNSVLKWLSVNFCIAKLSLSSTSSWAELVFIFNFHTTTHRKSSET